MPNCPACKEWVPGYPSWCFNVKQSFVSTKMPEPILARFPERLNGALIQIKQMPTWMWPAAMYDLVWPIMRWEMSAQTEPDSAALIESFSASHSPNLLMMELCDYMTKKLNEAKQ